MLRRLRFVMGLTLIFTLTTGSVAPVAARPVPKKESMVAMVWHQIALLLKADASPVIVPGITSASTITPYGVDAPTTTLSNLPVATNSCYGTDAPRLCLP